MSQQSTQHSPITNTRRGDVQGWSQTLIPTAREAPSDAELPSHKLLVRGGFIRRVTAGVYDYLPLGWRVLRKISQIVREEMNAAGGSELLLPALCPTELLKETGRAEMYGDLLFRFEDRHGRDSYLGPTHEEVIVEMARGSITSYKQLPLNLYQIQTKYRDEFRPRAGLLRGREFIMKDAYSFHLSMDGAAGLDAGYDAMYQAYTRIFTRCGLDFSAVEAEAGPIGGSASHEFMVNCESGEDTILVCPETGYAANVEKCEIGERPAPAGGWFAGEPSGDLDRVHTPDCPGIADVCKLLKVKTPHMLKTVVFQTSGENAPAKWVVAVVRGDQDVNEGKVRDEVGCAIALADAEQAKAAGFAIGYVSPAVVSKVESVLMLVDPDAATGMDVAKGKPRFWVTGSDEMDHHVKHFNWLRDLGTDPLSSDKIRVASVRNAAEGDPSPRAPGATLQARRGIEVGHIFKLGCKYSDAMGFAIMDAEQQRQSVIMGCYGIGVSRTLAACVEMSHDEDGIIWPAALAPYHVLITVMKAGDQRQAEVARQLADELSERGVDVLIDDRDERPGVKFKDADLIGLPVRVTLGDKALDQDSVELKGRRDPGKGSLVPRGEAISRCLELLGV